MNVYKISWTKYAGGFEYGFCRYTGKHLFTIYHTVKGYGLYRETKKLPGWFLTPSAAKDHAAAVMQKETDKKVKHEYN